MKTVWYSDPHIGLNLGANTTPDSRARLKQFVLSNVSNHTVPHPTIACAGDFFDTYQNAEEVIIASSPLARRTSKILAGNHDVTNIASRRGSLDVVDAMHPGRVVGCEFGASKFQTWEVGDIEYFLIPHHSSQDLYEAALDAAAVAAKGSLCPMQVLVAHSNYDSPFVKDTVTLELTKRKAASLLESFNFIMLGHEHNHRTDLGDRVIVIGSPHPVTYGDMTDKFLLSVEGGDVQLIQTWSANRHYLSTDHSTLLEKITADHQFVRITGDIHAAEVHVLASNIRKAWTSYRPFAIKTDVNILSGTSEQTRFEGMTPDRIIDIVKKELKDQPELLALFKEVSDAPLA